MKKSLRVDVDVDYVDAKAMGGTLVEGIKLECTRCDNFVNVCGVSARSFRYGYMLLHQGCPRDEKNFYHCPDEPEDAE